MVHDSHFGFIVAAYVVAFVVIGLMIAMIVSDHRALRKALERFGPRGSDRE